MKLRLTGNGYTNFTGHMGSVYFENGLSALDVLPVHAVRIGSTFGAQWENGVSTNPAELAVSNASMGAMNDSQETVFNQRLMEAQIHDANQAQTHLQKVAELGMTATIDPKAKLPQPELKTFTREQLEAIADESGLAGLREVASQMGVKGKSISELIERTLEAAGA